MRKRSLLLVAGACLATLSLTVGSALADPVPSGPRTFSGVGSDTATPVMNAYANGTTLSSPPYAGIGAPGPLTVASYDATGARITTKNTTQCTNLPRPDGSTDGANALAGLKTGFPAACVEFARSSNNDSASRRGQNLTFVPYALDGVTYATASASNVPTNLSLADLQTIYRANTTDPGGCSFQPLIPQAGSGTRAFWNTLVGPFGTCVSDQGNTIQEHDGRVVTNPDQLVPYGVGPWITQTTSPDAVDKHGNTALRAIDGKSPYNLETFPGRRTLYNVIRNSDVNTAPFDAVFGPNGEICKHPEVLAPFSLLPISTCGSKNIVTPN